MTLEPLDLIAPAAHYAGRAGAEMAWAERVPESRMEHYAAAQVWASLAGAAATIEAARLTLDAQASNLLSALEEPEPEDQYASYYCPREWVDEEAVIPSQVDGTDLRAHDGKPHRCAYAAGHEEGDPHYCRCGSEL